MRGRRRGGAPLGVGDSKGRDGAPGRRTRRGLSARTCVRACARGRGPQHAVREADVRAGWAGAADEMAEGGEYRERPDAETQKSELGALMRTTLQRGAQW